MRRKGEQEGVWAVDALSGRRALVLGGHRLRSVAVSPDLRSAVVSTGVGRLLSTDPAARSWVVGLRLFKLPQLAELRSALR